MAHSTTPSYRRQRCSGRPDRAFVEISGVRTYLGTHGTPESRQRYDRLIAEWLANGRRLAVDPHDITVDEVCAHFLDHVEGAYQKPANFVPAIRVLRSLYGDRRAIDIGPRALKTVRESMIALGWLRRYVNQNIDRLKRMFKWAASEEHIPASVHDALRTVDNLRRGKSAAVEREPVPAFRQSMLKRSNHLGRATSGR